MKTQDTIHWRSWDAEVYQEAQQTGKPIFLSISATWCHWCHVMDEESFTHPEVIRRLNGDFIPVRVDSDKRPDINSRYNMGGWPTVAILNSQGELVTGGTYLPTGQLLSMLAAHQASSRSTPPSVLGRHADDQPQTGRSALSKMHSPKIDEALVQTLVGFLERAFDRSFGGFGGPPKFPQVWAIEYLFHLHARTNERKWLEMASLTLDRMREGELYDSMDGGFFRYSASTDWESPHYEKLLDLNARMLSLYLKAYGLTDQSTYRATAQGVLDYLFSTLTIDGQAWFCGSQSADPDYYHQSETERLWAEAPSLDRTIYTDKNAIAASALLLSDHILGDAQYRDRALELIDFLWNHCYRPEQGMVHYDDGKLTLGGYLSDQVHMTNALLDAFEATGVHLYLNHAEDLAKFMEQYLWDGEAGGCWDLPVDSETLANLKVRVKPFVENAVASMAFTRLFHLTGQQVYEKRSASTLSYLSTVYRPYKYHAAPFALAVEQFLHPPHHVTVIGCPEDPRWGELLKKAHQLRTPWKVILPLDAEKDQERIKSLGYSPSDKPMAYLCVGKTCFPPVSRAEDLNLP
jgi:uncharacterized protein YyaL (SSP411 family)